MRTDVRSASSTHYLGSRCADRAQPTGGPERVIGLSRRNYRELRFLPTRRREEAPFLLRRREKPSPETQKVRFAEKSDHDLARLQTGAPHQVGFPRFRTFHDTAPVCGADNFYCGKDTRLRIVGRDSLSSSVGFRHNLQRFGRRCDACAMFNRIEKSRCLDGLLLEAPDEGGDGCDNGVIDLVM